MPVLDGFGNLTRAADVLRSSCLWYRQARFDGCVAPIGYGMTWSMSQNSAGIVGSQGKAPWLEPRRESVGAVDPSALSP